MWKGIDVSDNQGKIDWTQVAAAGVQFAILRSVRRSGKTDYQFAANLAGCRRYNIPVAVYKYTYATTEAQAQDVYKRQSQAWTAIQTTTTEIWNGIGEALSLLWETIKTTAGETFTGIKDTIVEAWNALKDRTGEIWDGIWNSIKGAINNIISGVEDMVNRVVSGINTMIDGINSLISSIPGVPGGAIPNLGTVSLPRLAQGGFVRANTPQLAMIGDNRHQGEVVAPEDKLQEMVDRAVAMASRDSTGMSDYYLEVMVDLLQRIIELIEQMDLTVTIDIRDIKKKLADLDKRSGYTLRTT